MARLLLPLRPDHPFAGVIIRLHRADENITNLQLEIFRFFQECKYPVMPDTGDERWQEALNYHRSLPIPKRFSVLAGEIFHHWRSCLDHIVWICSSAAYRKSYENVIQFPILAEVPNAKGVEKFERQIGGIVNPSKIRDLILGVQPYELGTESPNSFLKIVHDMDRFDKHRELLIVHSHGNLLLRPDASPEAVAALAAYTEKKLMSAAERGAVFRALKEQGKVVPDIAFTEFGAGKNQSVIPSLQQLSDTMQKMVANFIEAAS
jgi:hypothetical protein